MVKYRKKTTNKKDVVVFMTVIEFFDKDAIENVISSLLCNPDKVVFVGDNMKAMNKAIARYDRVLKNHEKSVEFYPVSVNRNILNEIVTVLTRLLHESGEIAIDLTGGEDLYLVAAGILHNSYPTKVQLHRFNINNGNLYDCDADGNVIQTSSDNFTLTVEENAAIYGGRIIYEDEKSPIVTHKWDFTDDFIEDINTMWDICCKDSKEWNILGTHLVSVVEDSNEQYLRLQMAKDLFSGIPNTINQLKRYGLISDVKTENEIISFECKNKQVKECLAKSGQLLEIKTTVTILSLREKEDNPVATDVMTGVVVGWDDNATDKKDVINEVDVVAMNGLIPAFISCKNGIVSVDELYKLNTVATRFGGKYAKKILIATDELGLIKLRAEEMNIDIVDNIGECGFDDKEKKRKLKNILK